MTQPSEQKNVVYARVGDRPLHMDIYAPTGPSNGAAVLLVHGGAWRQGSKDILVEHARHLARDGFVALACEYRLTPEAHWPAQIHDVRAAIRWARTKAADLGFDADRLCLQGHSAGAHLVLLAAGAAGDARLDGPDADTSIPTACAAVAAVYPPVLMYRGERQSGGVPASALPGSDLTDETAELASPITYVSADFPPVMLLHGDADKVVPVSASRRFEEALRRAGGQVDLHVFNGLPHGFGNHPEIRPMMMTMISGFFRRRVGAPEAFVFAPPPG